MQAFDQIPEIPILTNLSLLEEFNNNTNPPRFPSALRDLVPVPGLTFSDYLRMEHSLAGLWEMNEEGQLLGFSYFAGRMFLDLARTIISYHRREMFVGDLLGQVRIHTNTGGQLLAELPFAPIQSNNNRQILRDGIMCDVRHFRRMVALLVRRCFPDIAADALLSMPFNLFFSPIFTHDPCRYSAFQFFHPIFYSSEERVQFIHTLEDYKSSDEPSFYASFILEDEPTYGFREWWESINFGPLYKVFSRGTETHQWFRTANGLPHYIRCVHHHFLQNGYNSHEVADEFMHEWYPGYCAKFLDAIMRSFPHIKIHRETFEYHLFQPPFGFYIIE